MDEELYGLLEYREVLGVVSITADGLVVASAGVESDDADVIGAAGSTALISIQQQGLSGGSVSLDGGDLHVMEGDEMVLVVLTESDVPVENLEVPMKDALDRLDASLR